MEGVRGDKSIILKFVPTDKNTQVPYLILKYSRQYIIQILLLFITQIQILTVHNIEFY